MEGKTLMGYTQEAMPTPQALLDAWSVWRSTIGVTRIQTEEDYNHVVALMDMLIDEVRDDENHPLAEVLHYLGDVVAAYEDEHVSIPSASPAEVLRFLMEQHGLKQEDLADCAPQSRISDILNGRRPPSREIAKKLARRFGVHADVFL